MERDRESVCISECEGVYEYEYVRLIHGDEIVSIMSTVWLFKFIMVSYL